MSKRKLPRGISRFRDGYRVRLSVDGIQHLIGVYPYLKDAETALKIAWGQKAAGTFVPPVQQRAERRKRTLEERADRITVSEWSQHWLRALETGDKRLRIDKPRSPGTIRSYQSTLDAHVMQHLGHLFLDQLNEEHVTNVLHMVDLPGAKRNVARTLRAMLNAAAHPDVGHLKTPLRVDVPTLDQTDDFEREETTPSVDELREIVAAMPKQLRLAVLLAAWMGLRQGEVLGLQRQDFVDLNGPNSPRLRVVRQWLSKARPPAYADPKDGSRRRLAIPSALVPAIVEHLDKYVAEAPDAAVFPSPQNPKKPLSQTSLDAQWRAARDAVKPGLKFHGLRHFALTNYAAGGATLAEIQKRGGHRDPDVAMIYQDATADRDRILAEKLNTAIRESSLK